MASVRRDRQLGLITPNMQRYEADKVADWLDAIKRQVCPFCNAGPFAVVATHVNKIHGVNTRSLREMLGLTTKESICDPFTSKRLSQIAIERGTEHIGDARKRPRGRVKRTTEGQRRILAAHPRGFVSPDRKPHPCPECGTMIPNSHPRLCSKACRSAVKSRTAKATHTGRVIGPEEAARKAVGLLASNDRRRQPHPCPVCQREVPQARPLTCSDHCARQWNSLVQRGLVQPMTKRTLKKHAPEQAS